MLEHFNQIYSRSLPPLRGVTSPARYRGLTPPATFGQGSPALQPPLFPSSSSALRANLAATVLFKTL